MYPVISSQSPAIPMKLFPGNWEISLIAVFIFTHIFFSPFMVMMNGFPAIIFKLN